MLRLAGLCRAAKKNKGHSLQWVQRHVKDRYVQRAQEDNYRSRSAYKLKQLDTQFSFLKSRHNVVDLGCWCGGWSQVALQRTRCGSGTRPGLVIGVDLVSMEPLEHHHFVQGDIREPAVLQKVKQMLGDRAANVVLSDMAPKLTGNKHDDHMASMELCKHATLFAEAVLKEGGWFVTKVFDGALAKAYREDLQLKFGKVKIAKPAACRPESREVYYVCSQFIGMEALGTIGRGPPPPLPPRHRPVLDDDVDEEFPPRTEAPGRLPDATWPPPLPPLPPRGRPALDHDANGDNDVDEEFPPRPEAPRRPTDATWPPPLPPLSPLPPRRRPVLDDDNVNDDDNVDEEFPPRQEAPGRPPDATWPPPLQPLPPLREGGA